MTPEIKAQMTKVFQRAYDEAENETEGRKIYKIAEELGIKIQYLNDIFSGLKNFLL
jgi:hypothetical protein